MQVRGTAYYRVPSFETLAAPADEVQAAVQWALRQMRRGRAVLVYCAHVRGPLHRGGRLVAHPWCVLQTARSRTVASLLLPVHGG